MNASSHVSSTLHVCDFLLLYCFMSPLLIGKYLSVLKVMLNQTFIILKIGTTKGIDSIEPVKA
jgi:hypothetical protein